MAAPAASELALRLGEILKAARERAGISQEELGMCAGLHRTAVGQLERGERTPRADSVIRLAGSLGIPAGDLLAGVVWNPSVYRVGDYTVEQTEQASQEKGKSPESGATSKNQAKPKAQGSQSSQPEESQVSLQKSHPEEETQQPDTL